MFEAPRHLVKYVALSAFMLVIPAKAYAADVDAAASRTSGVAPLSVNFNADLTATSASERSFSDYLYIWDFGDAASGTWGTDGESKDSAYGPVSVHVFEEPGTYNVTLRVFDSADGSEVTGLAETFEITVDDPEVVYAGTKTTCISSSAEADFSGCPAGANQVTTDNLAADLPDYMDAGERVLLDRGSSWSVNTRPDLPSSGGPVTLGAYGACDAPDELGICSNAPAIEVSGGGSFFTSNYKQNWRIQDITFSNPGKDIDLMSGNILSQRWLFSRVKTTGFLSVFNVGHQRNSDSDYNDQLNVYSCDFQDFETYGVYFTGERVCVTGSRLEYNQSQHIIRLRLLYANVISHNILSGASFGVHVLKLHGVKHSDVGTFAETGVNGLRSHSEFSVVSDNLIGGSGVYSVAIGPQNAQSDERINDVIVERNRYQTGYGQRGGLAVQGFHIAADHVTLRNNVLDLTHADGTTRGIVFTRTGAEPSHTGLRVYNNTFYSHDAGDRSRVAIQISSGSDVVLRNNYVSFPGSTGAAHLLVDDTGAATESNNVMTDTPHLVDPNNSNVLDRNFALTAEATEAIDQGYATPLLDDFDSNSRVGTYDVGAYEYDSAPGGAGGRGGGSAGGAGGSAGSTGGSAGSEGGSAGSTGGSAGSAAGSAGSGGSAGNTGGSAGSASGASGTPDDSDDGGCSCRTMPAPTPTNSAWWLAGLAWVLVRRRQASSSRR